MKKYSKKGLALIMGLGMLFGSISPAVTYADEAETALVEASSIQEETESASETAEEALETAGDSYEADDALAESDADQQLAETTDDFETELTESVTETETVIIESETEVETETETETETEDEVGMLLLQETAQIVAQAYDVDADIDLEAELASLSAEELELIQAQAVTASANEPIIFNFIVNDMGLNVASACGILANFAGESSFRTTGIEGNYLASYRANGQILDEDWFAAAVDSGQISRSEFISSTTYGCSARYWSIYRGDSSYVGHYGYGLLQWTTESEKGGLYDYCKSHGYSIASLQGQLEYMAYEMEHVKYYIDPNGQLYDGKKVSLIHSFRNDVPNTEDGAARASTKFGCWHVGTYTGNYPVREERARTQYWPEYKDYENGNYAVDDELVLEFVTRLYQTCLDRNPDSTGLQSWADQLHAGSKTGVQVAHGFIFSNEFKAKNLCDEHYVEHLYLAFLGREPDSAGKASWVNQLRNGKSREAVFNGFAMSNEFAKLCEMYDITRGSKIAEPANGTTYSGNCTVCAETDQVEAFVERLYKICLNRSADAAGLANWADKLIEGDITGEKAAYGFFFSQEFVKKNYSNTSYVQYLYQALLNREADAAGLASWVRKLSARSSRSDIFYGFTGSDEFKKLCEEYGINAK